MQAFVLKRDNIDFECTLPSGGKLWGRLELLVIVKKVSSCESLREQFCVKSVRALRALRAPVALLEAH